MPHKTVVYLSGPMTGKPDFNFAAFDRAANELRNAGYRVINPADYGADPGTSYKQCLSRDLAILPNAQVIATLPGWRESNGAKLEVEVAKGLGLQVSTVADLLYIASLASAESQIETRTCIVGKDYVVMSQQPFVF